MKFAAASVSIVHLPRTMDVAFPGFDEDDAKLIASQPQTEILGMETSSCGNSGTLNYFK